MAALRASTKVMEAIRQSFENLKACHHNSDITGAYLFSGWKARLGAAASGQVNIEEHEAILLSLESRDPEGASRAMRMHLARGLQELQSDIDV